MNSAQQKPEAWVVVSAYGGPPDCLKEDGSRHGPIAWETNLEGATREAASKRAAQCERSGYGACRIARLVFEDEPAEPAKA